MIEKGKRLFWSWFPASDKEASEAVVKNFLFHGFPPRVSIKSIGYLATLWLGTITWILFVILAITGILLMFLYVPSVERAFHSMKDIQFVVSFGLVLRSMHRLAAHGMVAVAFFHLARIFYMKGYASPKGSSGNRVINWWIGLALFVVTIALSYTGYLLPWDQLAYWAVTIGVHVAKSVPVVGRFIAEKILMGGTEIGQNTLIRFYVLHCIVLPLTLVVLFAFHMWRIRKDGGLAIVDRIRRSLKPTDSLVFDGKKTYMLLGVKNVSISKYIDWSLPEKKTVPAVTELFPRLFFWTVLVTVILYVAAIYLPVDIKAPLEPPANPAHPPNPAKAPWYFLWLQELIAFTTVKIGNFTINGGFIGGVVVPGLALLALAVWPLIDKSPDDAIGVYFHRSRLVQNIVFTILALAVICLILSGEFCRGPFWKFYWPWQEWPELPSLF